MASAVATSTASTRPSPRPADPRNWTNAEVLHWLIDADQKQHVPAFIRHNVTGPLLVDLLSRADGPGSLSALLARQPGESERTSGSQNPEAIEGLVRLMKKQLLHTRRTTQRTTQEDAQRINGWTFQADQMIYNEYLEDEQLWHRSMCARDQLQQKKALFSMTSLLVSTLTTFLSVILVSIESGDSGAEDTTGVLKLVLGVIVAGFAGLLATLAGVAKVYDFEGRQDAWNEWCAGQSIPRLSYEHLMDELQLHPSQRSKSYAEWMDAYNREVREPCSAGPKRPDEPPGAWEETLTQIARQQPETWRKFFAPFYYILYNGEIFRKAPKRCHSAYEVPWWAWRLHTLSKLLGGRMVTFDPIVDNEEHVKALNDSSLVKGNFKDYWEVAYDKERSGKGSTHTGASETDGRQKQPSETAVRKQLFQKQPRTTEKTALVSGGENS
eukprot:scaffold131917_cov72-Phaeocystis_antarctica.AAC.3